MEGAMRFFNEALRQGLLGPLLLQSCRRGSVLRLALIGFRGGCWRMPIATLAKTSGWGTFPNRSTVSMTSTPLVNLASLLDDAKCFELIRQHRWPDGVCCPPCGSAAAARDGRDDTQPHRQRYRCTACGTRFDDLTGTVLAGHHQPLRVWVLCLYFMGLNLSNRQIAQELDLCVCDVQALSAALTSLRGIG